MSDWIRRERRHKIYERDGKRCVYCGTKANLSLDHIIPRSAFVKKGLAPDNRSNNLITACVSCNSRRRDKPIRKFARPWVVRRIDKLSSLPLPR